MLALSTAKSLFLAAASLAGAITDCNDSPDIGRQIAGCSIYIESGRATGQNLVAALVNRAIAYSAAHDYDKAFADFNAALRVDPESWLAHYNRANVYFDLGKDDLAIEDFNAAIGADPTAAMAYYNRGLAHERRGNITEAVDDYRHALSLDQTDEKAKARLDRLAPQ